ncbi:MAG: hypothetical protein Q7U76_12560 [Nitrospirota bacterium]|nr:hypothetical protein [Nitrospirota bacterium]
MRRLADGPSLPGFMTEDEWYDDRTDACAAAVGMTNGLILGMALDVALWLMIG